MTPDLIASYAQGHAVGDGFGVLILIIAIRDAVRKAIALRKSAKKSRITRFILLFIFNTAGILPIIYIFLFDKKNKKETEIFVKNIEEGAKKTIKQGEESIEHTIEKVEHLLKKAPVIKAPAKKPVAKKTPAKKPAAKKTK